jgi:hypothetical protein
VPFRNSFALTFAAALLAASVLAPTTATAALGGFSVRPAEANPRDPATRAYFKPTIRAGATFGGKLVVTNPGATPLRLLVSAVDGLTGVTSGAVYGNRQDPLHGAGRWLTPSVSSITVQPRGQRLVGFLARVPRSATAGEDLGGISFESADPVHTSGRFSIIEIFRVVIGVDIRVRGPASRAIRLRSATLSALPGTRLASVVVALANRGQLLCKPHLAVALRGAGRARVVRRRLDTVLPGDSIPYPLPWSASLAPGNYHVSVRATNCGAPASLAELVHAGGDLGGPAGSTSQRPQVKTRTIVPWWLLALIGVGGLVAGLIVALAIYASRRKHDDEPRARNDEHDARPASVSPVRGSST